MTTSIALIVMIALLVAGGVILVPGTKMKRLGGWRKMILSASIGVGILFILWMAIMVFVVGPAMRGI